MHNKRKLRQGGYLAAVTAVVAAIVLLVNLIVGQLPSNFFLNDTAATEIYTITVRDALPISHQNNIL